MPCLASLPSHHTDTLQLHTTTSSTSSSIAHPPTSPTPYIQPRLIQRVRFLIKVSLGFAACCCVHRDTSSSPWPQRRTPKTHTPLSLSVTHCHCHHHQRRRRPPAPSTLGIDRALLCTARALDTGHSPPIAPSYSPSTYLVTCRLLSWGLPRALSTIQVPKRVPSARCALTCHLQRLAYNNRVPSPPCLHHTSLPDLPPSLAPWAQFIAYHPC